MARSLNWSSFCPSIALRATSVDDMYRNKGSLLRGGTRIGGDIRYFLRSLNAVIHYAFHLNSTPLRSKTLKGIHLSDNLEIKRLIDCIRPCKLLSSLKLVGSGISEMALTFSGSTSMPRYDTMKPSSFLKRTPKTHFFGFSRTLCLTRRTKICLKTSTCPYHVVDLANISLT